MDAFYASVEQRDNPHLCGKPIAVGGGAERGVVAAASYEARKFGVRSAMPASVAKRKCPQLIFVKPRFDVYRSVSNQIRKIFLEYTKLVEPLSLDEAYLDVTHPLKGPNSATLIANEIRKRIDKELHLKASAGISFNKFLAKTASDVNKPNGFFVIKPEEAQAFIDKLPVSKFFGVGKVTAEKLHKLGIKNGAGLKKTEKEVLIRHFGKHGIFFYNIARGYDNRDVQPERIRKSVGAENTFFHDLSTTQELNQAMEDICQTLFLRLTKADMWGKTLTVKIKYHDFNQITRSRTFVEPVTDKDMIFEQSVQLLHENRQKDKPIRLLGATFSQLESNQHSNGKQLRLQFW